MLELDVVREKLAETLEFTDQLHPTRFNTRYMR